MKTNSKKVAKNTLMLYFRQILIMLVSLYTVRVVLNVLGTQDYGIYNVVAGVVTMFSFLSGSMATASQRYFSFYLGKDDYKGLKNVYNITFLIYIILVLIVLVFAETLGLWFINNKLVIPVERMRASNFLYQTVILSFIMSMINAPYMACIIAHEKMNIYAYVSIIEALLKLGTVFVLKFLMCDKLILYGLLLLLVSIVITSIYRFCCIRKFEECKFNFYWNKGLFKEITSYSVWNLFGASVSVIKNQIINILLNIFFGPVTNAARGVAAQVNSAVYSFGNNFSTALRPQIIKTYANNERKECISLVYRGCKLTFFLMFIIILPLSIEADFVLKVWLKNPPMDAVLFTRLVLIDCLIESMNYQIMTLAQATGKIKLYQAVVGGILMLNLPISYFVLKIGMPAYSVLMVNIFLTIIAAFVRLLIIKKIVDFSIIDYTKKVIIPCFIVVIVSLVIPFLLNIKIKNEIIKFFTVCFASVVFSAIAIFFIGFNKEERNSIILFIKRKFGAKK